MQSRIDYTLFEGCTEGRLQVQTCELRNRMILHTLVKGGLVLAEYKGPPCTHADANFRLFAAAPILLEEHKALMEENERLRELVRRVVLSTGTLPHSKTTDDYRTMISGEVVALARAALQDKSSGV